MHGLVNPQALKRHQMDHRGVGVEASRYRAAISRGNQQALYKESSPHRAGGYCDTRGDPQQAAPHYRTTIYHDNDRTWIEETKRYSQSSNGRIAKSQSRVIEYLPASNGSSVFKIPVPDMRRKREGYPRSSETVVIGKPDAPTRRTKSRPVVTYAMSIAENKISRSKSFAPGEVPLTPPHTPDLGRLPTPDLPDIDEKVRFCHCCQGYDKTHICEL